MPTADSIRHVQLAMAFAASALISLHAQPPRRPDKEGVSVGSRVVSPAVVATWIARRQPSGAARLDLLVLWRGIPGWFIGDESRGSTWGGAAAGGPGTDPQERGAIAHRSMFGGVILDVRFDDSARVARVQDREISLSDANVLLVDGVHAPGSHAAIEARRIEPAISDSPVHVDRWIASSSELIEFLRCDTVLRDPRVHQVIGVCDRIARP